MQATQKCKKARQGIRSEFGDSAYAITETVRKELKVTYTVRALG